MSLELNGKNLEMVFFSLIKYFIDLFREGWDRCRAMTKEQAMLAYIDEIRKVNKNQQAYIVDGFF